MRTYADEHADLLFLGTYGAKKELGEAWHDQIGYDQIGTTAALITTGCQAVCCLVTHACRALPAKGRRFLVGVDGCDLSHAAVEEAMRYMKKGDYLQLVYVESEGESGEILLEKYDKFLISQKVKGVGESIGLCSGLTIADEILDVAETGASGDEFGAVNIVVIGSAGLSTKLPPRGTDAYFEYKQAKRKAAKKGSVAQSIVHNAQQCAIMVLTIDSMLSGAVKSREFQNWFSQML